MYSYRFTNLLGATYKGGSVQFTPDGNALLSPVSNRVNVVDLVQGQSHTLAPENREDVSILALSPDGTLLLSIDHQGHALLLNFVRSAVLCRINFKTAVRCATWSPNSEFLAVTQGKRLGLWRAPTVRLGWQFVHHTTISGPLEDIIDVAWTPNSLFLAAASRDMSVRLFSVDPMDGFQSMVLAEHRSHVRSVFFSEDMHRLYSLSRDGVLVSLLYELESVTDTEVNDEERPLFCRPGTWKLDAKAYCQQPQFQKVTRCSYDAGSRILAVGFSGGIFMLFELPGMETLQTLSLGTSSLDAVALGAKGDWLAIGSADAGQLLVWEWRSETYVLKQQGHLWGVQCAAFSPAGPRSLKHDKSWGANEDRADSAGSSLSGRLLATGGYDGKVKLFNSQSGLCFVTFAEHTAPVSALCFTQQGNAVISASKDGSVRAFDMLRYRNFRTFVSPDGLCQFAGVAVDGGGEIVAASAVGGNYSIYVWSIQTGNILDVLTGHTSFVQSLRFSNSASTPGQIVTGSWDGTLKVWDLYAGAGRGRSAETLQCPSSVLSVAHDPRGNDLCACSCLAGQVIFWNVSTGSEVGFIDGIRDIRRGRQFHERFAATNTRGVTLGKKNKTGSIENVNLNAFYSSIAYARSGQLLLCGSKNSPLVCLYDTQSFTLAARLTLTTNRSIGGVNVLLNSKNMTEAGVSWQEYDLTDSEAEDVDLERKRKRHRQETALPGVTVGEAKDSYTERELHVWDVAFSSDSQYFAAATTHGVFIFGADVGMGTPGGSATCPFGSDVARFTPQILTKRVSAPAILKALDHGDVAKAMILALALNDRVLLRKAYEAVPVKEVPIVVASIGAPLLPALIWFLSQELKPSGTPHFQFHMTWVEAIMDLHFLTLSELSAGKSRTATLESAVRANVPALCLQLLVELTQRHAGMARTFSSNTYLLRYLSQQSTEAGSGDPKKPALVDLSNQKRKKSAGASLSVVKESDETVKELVEKAEEAGEPEGSPLKRAKKGRKGVKKMRNTHS